MKTKQNLIQICLLWTVFTIGIASAQADLINGANETGTLLANTTNSYTFTANKGDSLNVRLGTTGFYGWLKLYGPNGALLGQDYDDYDTLVSYTATNSGTFTVLVSSWSTDGHGAYALNLAQVPEPFIVPAGDEGGAMTNGGNYAGTVSLGDMDMYSFTANAGDSLNVRLGTTGFYGWLKLYGPNGALLGQDYDDYDTLVSYTATNSGTFTVLVSSWSTDGHGAYALNLAQVPEPFIVPAGDEGGGLSGNSSYIGTITLGDLDIWRFTACQGDLINLRLNTTNFYGKLQLYGTNGVLLKTAQDNTALSIAYNVTNCGTFTVLVSSYSTDGTGTYGLTANGLADKLKVCPPIISGTSLKVNGVGGMTGAGFVLYSTTNITVPFELWTPVLTNQFDQFGVFTYTNGYNPTETQKYFRLVLP